MESWQLQDAKSQLCELVRRVESEGPQEITVRGRPVAVVLSHQEYERLTGGGESLADFIRRSPLHGCDELDLSRDRSPTRDLAL